MHSTQHSKNNDVEVPNNNRSEGKNNNNKSINSNSQQQQRIATAVAPNESIMSNQITRKSCNDGIKLKECKRPDHSYIGMADDGGDIVNASANGKTITNQNNYQNDGRRDSTQAWTPLLSNGNGCGGGGEGGGGGGGSITGDGDRADDDDGIDKTVIVGCGNTTATDNSTSNIASQAAITMNDIGDMASSRAINSAGLYNNATSNNNEWRDAKDINNLKNGLLHLRHVHGMQEKTNNNGSLINSKNGVGLMPSDTFGEQDPLTGLYHSSNAAGENDDHQNASDTHTCGLFGCRPKWARNFASTHVFMIVFLLAYILQGMYMTYFVSVITTIEKLFQIKSKTTGFLLSASEMGQISTAMLLTYFAGRGHRPRWIACGMVLFSIAAFSCSLPHFIFGKQLMHTSPLLKSDKINLTLGNGLLHFENSAGAGAGATGMDWTALNSSSAMSSQGLTLNTHSLNLCLNSDSNATISSSECNEDRKLEQASHSKITVIVLCIFFVSLLSSGIGQTAVATLGIPYIDDNVASKQSPMYMAITIGVRILGPASGFIVGSFSTRWYVNFSNPGFDASDPRWIGAWWLGPVFIGSLMMLSSIAMFSFPKELRGKRTPNNLQQKAENNIQTDASATPVVDEKPKLKDFPKTVRRQLSNDILMFRTASCVFHLLPIAGLYTFLPKYLETQFRLATYDANMIAAFCGVLVMGVGIVISGLVILKLKPSAKSVAAWIAFTAFVYSAGMALLMFVGCSMNDFAGYKVGNNSTAALIEPACSAALDCTCDRENFAPICSVSGKIYISSCHAGCTTSELRSSDNRTVFSNCACIEDAASYPNGGNGLYEAINGYCDSNCQNFTLFILIFVVCVFMHSTSEVGSMLLVMRCTHPKDKAMAMGVIQSAIGLFGNVPCPIIYGAVVDSACLIWKTVCGKHGACSLYDSDTFRHYFLGITSGIMFLAFIMDLVVWSKAHRIDIAPEDNNNPNEENKNDIDDETRTETINHENKNKSMSPPDASV